MYSAHKNKLTIFDMIKIQKLSKSINILDILTNLLLIIIGYIYYPITYGLVTYLFWDWFIIPVFSSLPSISYGEAIGLSLIPLYVKEPYRHQSNKDKFIVINVYYPFITIFIGFLIHQLI